MSATASSWHALRQRVRRPGQLLNALRTRISDDRIATLAAALSYYFFFALFPFLLFLLSLVTMLPGVGGIEDWLLEQAAQFVPDTAFGMLETTIRGILAQPRSGLLSLGAGLALWSASAALAGVADALNVAYGVEETRPWWRVRLRALWLTVALSFFMILAFVLAVGSTPLARWVAGYLGPLGGVGLLAANWLVVIAAVTLVVATIYDACPDVELPWRWFSPGSVLFTLGFGATSLAFSTYVSRFGSYDRTYGSLGAVIILLLWMYLLALFLLLGGELNALLDRDEGVGATPPPRPADEGTAPPSDANPPLRPAGDDAPA
ncbi:MAG: YihY/virulence factor BrkB family protein [bacterium]|nr:YihY/virulence factor BrkB family protein [bacterium]